MFQQPKNIDTAFRQFRMFCFCYTVVITLGFGYLAYQCFAEVRQHDQRVYVLDNGKAIEALASDRKENIPVEARDHIATFHHYFFTLDPDDKLIQSNITRSLYLADNSAEKVYENLKEQGYYANIISGNISQQVTVDSIALDMSAYPYHFHFYGKEKLVRATSIVTRKLVTEGYLRNTERSDNDPHGFLIERWSIVDNSDISSQNRQQGQ